MSTLHGRGTADNPANRFLRMHVEQSPDDDPEGPQAPPKTVVTQDESRSIITRNGCSDLPYAATLNPYRGCEHGCIYCYARPYHEYLGFSAGLDFETQIIAKHEAPALLRKELLRERWLPQGILLSGATDPYQPLERDLKITRGCLEVLAEFRNPVSIITKNALILRDLDLLKRLAEFRCVSVNLSITAMDESLRAVLEPRTATALKRLDALAKLNEAGIPAGIMIAPVIPGLNDHEVPVILAEAGKAGALFAGCLPVRLPQSVEPLFLQWLTDHFPQRKEKVLARIRAIHGGALDDARPFVRFKGEGIRAEQLRQMFEIARRRAGIPEKRPRLSTKAFRRPGTTRQMFG